MKRSVISEVNNHSRIVAFSCVNKVFNFVREKHNLPLKVTLKLCMERWLRWANSIQVRLLITINN